VDEWPRYARFELKKAKLFLKSASNEEATELEFLNDMIAALMAA
jgi:hypothetical protein